MRFVKKSALPLVVTGFLAAAWCLAADPSPKDAPPTAASRGLVVHEWGTFSTFSGSDGRNLEFQPYDNDLPEFVHGYLSRNSKAGPRGGTISLETPVLYFYSERALTASVKVSFPKGTLTEWYPQADRTDTKLAWQGIEVLPKEDLNLKEEKQESRYYAARETDADPLRVTFYDKEEGRMAVEQEKFLFYRGVGDFDMPLSVRAWGNGKFTASWDGKGPWGDMILVQVQAGKVRFKQFSLDHRGASVAQADVRVPDRDSTVDQLSEAMVGLLTDKGIYEKEARAMVKTWRPAWFGEEGTRVLYILPEGMTDDLLPLKVEPKPAALLRVLVGRHDVLTPERERRIDACVAKLSSERSDENDEQKAAEAEMAKLGRYSGAAWTEAGERLKNRR